MSQSKNKDVSINSLKRGAIKTTLKEEQYLSRFQVRILRACQYHLHRRKKPKKIEIELLRDFKNAMETLRATTFDLGTLGVKSSGVAMGYNLKILQKDEDEIFLLERLKNLEKQRAPRGRRPTIKHGDIAALILSALDRFKGNRNMIDGIGALIQENGFLHKRLKSRYGEGAFEYFNFPIIARKSQEITVRWERTCKKALTEKANSYYNAIYERHSRDDSLQKEERFWRWIRKGAVTGFEIADSYDEELRRQSESES